MSEQEPSHEVKGIVRRVLRQDCVEAQIWGRVPKKVCSIHKWKKFGTTKDCPRAIRGEGPGSGRRALVREVTKNPIVTLTQLQITTISAALHQSGLHGRVARWKSLLSKRHMTAHSDFCQKAPKGLSDHD
jgi:hypothetical protein